MTDLEFELLDEMYFVIHFEELLGKLNWEKETLIKELKNLLQKKWAKPLDPQSMLELNPLPNPNDITTYCFLATKQGLLAHNSK